MMCENQTTVQGLLRHILLARKCGPAVGQLDEGDVVLEGGPGAAVARVLHEVVGEEDLPPGLVPVQVVHAHVRVGAVGAARRKQNQGTSFIRGTERHIRWVVKFDPWSISNDKIYHIKREKI